MICRALILSFVMVLLAGAPAEASAWTSGRLIAVKLEPARAAKADEKALKQAENALEKAIDKVQKDVDKVDKDAEKADGEAPKAEDDASEDAGEPEEDAETPASSGAAPSALGPAGPPVAGKRIAANLAGGEVRIRLPGSKDFVALSTASTMPVGSLIDASAGSVELQAALPGHGTDRGVFGGGSFEVGQNLRGGVTEIRLRGGSYARCNAHTLSADGKPRVIRRLWGRDRGGRFRTHGHNSVATVRGTRWLTEDRCDGTLTRVSEGAVDVRARRGGRRVLLRAGDSFLARRAPR